MAIVTGTTMGPSPPASYTGCHSHGEELYVLSDIHSFSWRCTFLIIDRYCYGPDAEETPFATEGAAAVAPEETGGSVASNEGPERNCHFHAGVE